MEKILVTGGCGYIGCGDYADAIVNKGAAIDLCPVGPSQDEAEKADEKQGEDHGNSDGNRKFHNYSLEREEKEAGKN